MRCYVRKIRQLYRLRHGVDVAGVALGEDVAQVQF